MRGDLFSPARWLMRRIRREVMRLSPEGRAALLTTGSGRLKGQHLPAALAALRALAPPDPEVCWFCGRVRAERRRVVSGGLARICEDCVRSAAAALSAPGAAAGATESKRCGFCGEWSGAEAWLVGGEARLFRGRHAAICNKCVALCLEILRDDEGAPTCGAPKWTARASAARRRRLTAAARPSAGPST